MVFNNILKDKTSFTSTNIIFVNNILSFTTIISIFNQNYFCNFFIWNFVNKTNFIIFNSFFIYFITKSISSNIRKIFFWIFNLGWKNRMSRPSLKIGIFCTYFKWSWKFWTSSFKTNGLEFLLVNWGSNLNVTFFEDIFRD